MLFDSKDEKITRLDKKIYGMERRMEQGLQRMNETITTLKEIIIKLQTENTQLRSERDFLVERHKKMLRRVPVPDLAGEISERLVKPAAGRIKENAEFVQLLAKEGFVEIREKRAPPKRKPLDNPAKELKEIIAGTPKQSHGKTVDRLFEMVSSAGRIRSDEAARRLNVHEVQVEEWARILEDHELITVRKTPLGKLELSKV